MNSKNKNFKEWLKICKDIQNLEYAKRNQNLIPLDEPYKNGYWVEFDLRKDIKNRVDAWVYETCIEISGSYSWCKDKTMKRKLSKGKYEDIVLEFRSIEERKYQNLPIQVQKCFFEIRYGSRDWNPFVKKYDCVIPRHFFVYKLTPRWITHYTELDSVLEKEIAEKEDKVYKNKKFLGLSERNYDSVPKGFCKTFNRAFRSKNKNSLKRNISSPDNDQYEYLYSHKHSARWYYW